MKYLTAVLMMGLLSACSLGATSPSEQPLESIGQSESMQPSMAPSEGAGMSMEESAMASPSEGGMTSTACEDAWQAVDTSNVQSVSDLEAIANDLTQTFQDCETVSDWSSAANDALPMLDTSELESWATAQCALDDAISQSPVCTEIGS